MNSALQVGTEDVTAQAAAFRELFGALEREVAKTIVGQETVVQQLLTCLFAGGHALLEGVPGLGKTQAARALSECLALDHSRIQFTPDLMPGDIIGTQLIVEAEHGREFRFAKGPLFTQVLIADEINRATPKTQSALLEAMQERAVTVAGTRHALDEPFIVLATQNPIEIEGTYALPEAQLDRFAFKIEVGYPREDALRDIVERTTGAPAPALQALTDAATINGFRALVREVVLPEAVRDYVARVLLATQPTHASATASVQRFARYGASPRGGQALVLGAKVAALNDGRYNVSFDDVRSLCHPALRHRLVLNFEGEAEGITPGALVDEVLAAVPADR